MCRSPLLPIMPQSCSPGKKRDRCRQRTCCRVWLSQAMSSIYAVAELIEIAPAGISRDAEAGDPRLAIAWGTAVPEPLADRGVAAAEVAPGPSAGLPVEPTGAVKGAVEESHKEADMQDTSDGNNIADSTSRGTPREEDATAACGIGPQTPVKQEACHKAEGHARHEHESTARDISAPTPASKERLDD